MVALPLGTAHSGVTSERADGEAPKMEEMDLRACICRIDLSEVRGEAGEAEGALRAIGSGEGVRVKRMDQVEEADRVTSDCSGTVAGGMRVRLRRRELALSLEVMMIGQLVWARVMPVEEKPKALGLGDRPVAGEVLGRAGLAGRGARACWRSHAAGMGEEMCCAEAVEPELELAVELAPLPKKKVRERARRRGDLVACVAMALLG